MWTIGRSKTAINPSRASFSSSGLSWGCIFPLPGGTGLRSQAAGGIPCGVFEECLASRPLQWLHSGRMMSETKIIHMSRHKSHQARSDVLGSSNKPLFCHNSLADKREKEWFKWWNDDMTSVLWHLCRAILCTAAGTRQVRLFRLAVIRELRHDERHRLQSQNQNVTRFWSNPRLKPSALLSFSVLKTFSDSDIYFNNTHNFIMLLYINISRFK